MAGKLRHFNENHGRYGARFSIPAKLRPLFHNKTQLKKALGGDRRTALEEHPAAVASLKAQIAVAQQALDTTTSRVSLQGAPPVKAAARRLAQDGYRVEILSSSGKGEALAKELGGVFYALSPVDWRERADL